MAEFWGSSGAIWWDMLLAEALVAVLFFCRRRMYWQNSMSASSAVMSTEHSNTGPELMFPDEILIKIFSHCDLQTLYNVMQVCHHFKQCADVQSVW